MNKRTHRLIAAEPDALKRLQAESAVNDTGQATGELDALLPAFLDRVFKGGL